MSHKLGSGTIVIKENQILLVKDNNGWGLPKGGTEVGETFAETAKREVLEETWYNIGVKDVAFITEFKSKRFGQYLQVYYHGEIYSKENTTNPDQDIIEIKFVPIYNLRKYIKFRPWILPLENWLEQKSMKFHSFDLDKEGFEVE